MYLCSGLVASNATCCMTFMGFLNTCTWHVHLLALLRKRLKSLVKQLMITTCTTSTTTTTKVTRSNVRIYSVPASPCHEIYMARLDFSNTTGWPATRRSDLYTRHGYEPSPRKLKRDRCLLGLLIINKIWMNTECSSDFHLLQLRLRILLCY